MIYNQAAERIRAVPHDGGLRWSSTVWNTLHMGDHDPQSSKIIEAPHSITFWDNRSPPMEGSSLNLQMKPDHLHCFGQRYYCYYHQIKGNNHEMHFLVIHWWEYSYFRITSSFAIDLRNTKSDSSLSSNSWMCSFSSNWTSVIVKMTRFLPVLINIFLSGAQWTTKDLTMQRCSHYWNTFSEQKRKGSRGNQKWMTGVFKFSFKRAKESRTTKNPGKLKNWGDGARSFRSSWYRCLKIEHLRSVLSASDICMITSMKFWELQTFPFILRVQDLHFIQSQYLMVTTDCCN